MSRHSLKNSLRQVRGARNAADRTRIRYGKRPLVAARIRRAMVLLNAVERELCAALGMTMRETKARAA